MKRKILFILFLVLTYVLSACGGGNAANTSEAETIVATTQTSPYQETVFLTSPQEATEDASEKAIGEYEIPAIPEAGFYLPLVDYIGDMVFADAGYDENGCINIIYNNGSQEALDEYLYYCSACGLYNIELELDSGLTVYYLYPMGVAYFGAVYLDPDTNQMVVITEPIENMLDQNSVDAYMSYYEQELSFPADYGKNVFPQFYASIGVLQPMGFIGSEVDYVFDGGSFWSEIYSDVSYEAVRKYLDEMILCGFDVWIVTGIQDDDGALQTTVLQLSNGDADVVLSYNAETESASIYYESGTMWTLLYGEDYSRYIPQR